MKSFKFFRSLESKEDSNETKKCHECLADIPKEAKKCSHCGSKQKIHVTKKQIVYFAIIALFFIILISGGDDNVSTTQPPEITDSKVYVTARNYVENVLKSPSTADFPLLDYRFFDLGNQKYKIVSYVDAQNSFGAQVRTNYSVTLSHNGGDWADINNWTLHELVFGGEIMYQKPNIAE